jgi:serine O-acetyltransferase
MNAGRAGLARRREADRGGSGFPSTEDVASSFWGKDERIPRFRDLVALWREDRAAHKGNAFSPGFQALAVHRFGVWARSRRSRFAVRVFRRVHVMLQWVTRSLHGIELPAKARIGRRVRFAHQGGVVVHMDAVIGDDCLIRHGVTIGLASDGPGERPPHVGNRVKIGAGAVVVGAIKVGDDVVIGANAVVRRDVPPGALVLPPEPTVVLR